MKNSQIAANTTTPKAESNPNISMSYEEIAKELGITVKEVKDAEASAIKKLRHPKIGKAMKDYLGISSGLESEGF
jgi:ribosome-binding protein aMBF1 (putative translation factor)